MMVACLSASKSVQSMAISMLSRAPTTCGTQRANNSLTSIPGLDSNRSTCLIACLLKIPTRQGQPMADSTNGQGCAGHHAQYRVRKGVDALRMHILSKQRLDGIVGIFKFCDSITNNHWPPPPNQHMGQDSHSFNLRSTFYRTSYTCLRFRAHS